MKKLILSCLALYALAGLAGCTNVPDTLVYASWDKLPEDTREFFGDFFEGDLEKGEYFYRSYFMKFNPVHEVSHSLRAVYGVDATLYDEEQSVNDITVAYWREIGEEEFIDSLEVILLECLRGMKNPVPEGENPRDFFNENYHNLGDDPGLYGYFQFTFVLNSIGKTESFHSALEQNLTSAARMKKSGMVFEPLPVESVDPPEVVENFRKYLELHNIHAPEIKFKNKFRTTIQSIN